MRLIICDIQLFLTDQRLYVYDTDESVTLYTEMVSINDVPRAVSALAGSFDVTEVRLFGQNEFCLAEAEEIKSVYSLNYGKNNLNEECLELLKQGEAILVCPEQMGGLQTPRNPSEIKIIDGEIKVFMNDGRDVTENYKRGAEEVLKLAKELNIKKAIFRKKSPSCGCGEIYDGTFTNTLTKGNGITASLLIENGIEVEVR